MATDLRELAGRLKQVLTAGPPLRIAVLFGSAVKGHLRPDSDLDVGIVPEDSELPLRAELELARNLTAACGREVDVVRLDRASAQLRWEAARAHVALLSRPNSTLPRFLAETALEHADLAPLLADSAARLRRRLAEAGNGDREPQGLDADPENG